MTSTQLSEWEAYDKLDPVGTWRDDYRIALLTSVVMNIANSLYGKKGEIKTFNPLDFMPDWDLENRKKKEQKPAKSVEEMKRILLGIARAQNKKVAKEKMNINKPPVKRTK